MIYIMNLNSKYFQNLKNKDGYSVIRCKDTPHLVLFSKINGSPLASIAFRSQNGKEKTLISHLPSDTEGRYRFQGLIAEDDQEFEFVITNLLNEQSNYINFNILKTDEKVKETNPGGLNEINELRPNESYAVQCDNANNLSLILSSLKKDRDGVEMSIKEDEENAKKTGAKTKGTYFYLSVVPVKDSKTAHLFTDTVWKVTEYFVRKENSPFVQERFGPLTVPRSGYPGSGVYSCDTRKFSANIDIQPFDDGDNFDLFDNVPSIKNRTIESFPQQKKNLLKNSITDFKLNQLSPIQEKAEACAAEDTGFPDYSEEYEEDCENLEFDLFDDTPSLPINVKNSESNRYNGKTPSIPVDVKNPFKPNKDEDIYNSKASRIVGGRYIKVLSAQTDVSYDFDKPSAPCVLGLSVMENMVFNKPQSESDIIQQGILLIDDLKAYESESDKKRYLEFIKGKTYDQELCCICLTDEPDTVFYTCGHKAVKFECLEKDLKNCPVCRTYIDAYLRVTIDKDDDLSHVDKNVVDRSQVLV